MISFPNAKINLGLRIIKKRSDGFHDIESILYPIELCDVLEVLESKNGKTIFKCTGLIIDAPSSKISTGVKVQDNLVLKIYELLAKDFDLPPAYIHLYKAIPAGAGLGGGSSDCAHALKMFNSIFNLCLTPQQQMHYVLQLGSDCAFFLKNQPALASGRGEILQPIAVDLNGYHICIIKPNIHINTAKAYTWVKPAKAAESLSVIINEPIHDWKHCLKNDFESAVFAKFAELKNLKEDFYQAGAVYAAMSGSGSAVFGIYKNKPAIFDVPDNWFQWTGFITGNKL
jgi:4-diphosphocytidyl-2-C-methyl-D-erythritol kinase